MLIDYVEGASFIGDPIYDAHKSPEWNKAVFFFVRQPDTWLRSLWYHRARKKGNKFGKSFNWQTNHRLENECKSNNYEKFIDNIINTPDCLYDYYQDFIGKYRPEQLIWGQYENLCEDLIKILNINNENFDEKAIRNNKNKLINKHSNNRSKYATDNFQKLMDSEKKFMKKYYECY